MVNALVEKWLINCPPKPKERNLTRWIKTKELLDELQAILDSDD